MPSLIAHAYATGAGPAVTTPAINATGANLIVAFVSYYASGGLPPMSDSSSNSWTKFRQQDSSVGISGYYCYRRSSRPRKPSRPAVRRRRS